MDEATFVDPPRQPVVTQLRLGRVLLLVGVLVLAVLGGGVVYVRSKATPAAQAPTPADTVVAASWMRKPPAYAPPPATPSVVSPSVAHRPVQAGIGNGLPTVPQPPAVVPEPPYEPEGTPQALTPPVAPRPASPTKQPSASATAPKPVVRKWLFAEMAMPHRTPFTARTSPGTAEGGASTAALPPTPGSQAGGLIKQARWEVPEYPLRTLFPSQVIRGTLLHDVVSTIPSDVRLMVTEAVEDKFFQGEVLIPAYSVLIGQQTAAPKYGEDRLEIGLRLAEYPNGTVLDFTTGTVSDGAGGSGLPGRVNKHYPELILATMLSTALSVGSRMVVQNRGTFRPTVEEEIAAEISRGVNTAGQQIIKRELDRPVTITIPHGSNVTIQLKQPVSLQTAPVLVEK